MIPSWLEIAKKEIGVHETPGPAATKRIVEYHAATSLRPTSDEVPWCASFVNWCLIQAGLKGTGLANARSFLGWGVPLDEPEVGCIVVFSRGSDPSAGHVAFYLSASSIKNNILVLGGNQADQVKITAYRNDTVLGYRWPKEVPA